MSHNFHYALKSADFKPKDDHTSTDWATWPMYIRRQLYRIITHSRLIQRRDGLHETHTAALIQFHSSTTLPWCTDDRHAINKRTRGGASVYLSYSGPSHSWAVWRCQSLSRGSSHATLARPSAATQHRCRQK